MTLIAIDVGGTSMKAALVPAPSGSAPSSAGAGAGGEVLISETWPTDRADPVGGILDFAAHMAARAEALGRPARAAGIAVPGIVDEASGTAVRAANLGWRDVPLLHLAQERLGVPVAVGHDVRTGGLAEAVLGAGRDAGDFVFMAIGTGIAAALILNGTTYPGVSGWSGEVGHIVVRPGGEDCACGNKGCLETYASAASIARRYTTGHAAVPVTVAGSTQNGAAGTAGSAATSTAPGTAVSGTGTTPGTTVADADSTLGSAASDASNTTGSTRGGATGGTRAGATSSAASDAGGVTGSTSLTVDGTAIGTTANAGSSAGSAGGSGVDGAALSSADGTAPDDESGLGTIRAEDVIARAGTDDLAARIWSEALDCLADSLAATTLLLDPGLFVLGGGLAQAGPLLLEPLQSRLAERLLFRPAPPLAVTRLGDRAAVHGAALLAARLL
ncbi:N-acetyl-D-glucosamine kinase [Actinomadura sp. RB99]|uniref:ROK family protein n=1 Tax=Actinomadura sp. RB99 TaxID=2691577 RepID=UPI0016843D63|nr:N-acetyl-D-glucosamine kinase [Actinomadura sp. RB99]